VWDDKSHGPLTERAVTRATGNKIDPDKHRLIHIHTPTLDKHRCEHRLVCREHHYREPHPDATSHLHRIASDISSVYMRFIITHTHARTHTHTQIQRLICIHGHQTHTHTVTLTVKNTLTHSQSHTHVRTQIRVLTCIQVRSTSKSKSTWRRHPHRE
jgi:hypothetical protein